MDKDNLYNYNNDTTFVYIDASKKQEFIYDTKKTKENIERSLVIRLITEWISENEAKEIENIKDEHKRKVITLKKEAEKNGAELIFSGGGNSIIKFKKKVAAECFIKSYSLLVLQRHPDLELYMSAVNVGKFIDDKKEIKMDDLKLEPLIHKELEDKLNEIKDNRKSRLRKLSYGIEKIKSDSDYTTEKADENKDYVKTMKTHFAKHIATALVESDKELSNNNWIEEKGKKIKEIEERITFEFDEYKKSERAEDKNYMGIVAIDGNKMGEMVRNLKNFYLGELETDKIDKEDFKKLSENNYFKSLKLFGEQINDVYANAIRKAIRQENRKEDEPYYKELKNCKITPIVVAGDDITIVVKATLAIKLASQILENIEDEIVNIDTEDINNDKYSVVKELMKLLELEKLTAGAGIAIVKPGYPFFEAITVAEKIQKKSKEAIYKFSENDENTNHSFLNWEVIQGGKIETIDYSKYADKGSKIKEYHVKPLYIIGREPKANKLQSKNGNRFIIKPKEDSSINIYTFEGFEFLVDKLNEMKWDCESIKKAMYGADGRYEMIFEMSKEDRIKKIDEVLKINEATGIEIKNGKLIEKNRETYLLNDFIDIRDFL